MRIRSPAFRLFGAVGTRNPVGPVATVFPEFIARDGQERADGGRQGKKRRVGAARRRSRGHGPARLDGTRERATVADKVMESGKTAGHGNGHLPRRPHGKRKRAGPKLEAGPEASAERSEGTMEARQGRDAAGGSMRSTTARRRNAGMPDCLGQDYSVSVLRCSICNCARSAACCSRSTSTPLGGKAVRYSAT
ncbi:hypothetical protein G6F62_014006 [Rhizopus arrhizus]|nr:hypothetical protein G6F62_014006 [Rhizopus arrhizus]